MRSGDLIIDAIPSKDGYEGVTITHVPSGHKASCSIHEDRKSNATVALRELVTLVRLGQ